IRSLATDNAFSAYVPIGRQEKLVEGLLSLPDEGSGEPVDLATPKQLAEWLVQRLHATSPEIVARLDTEVVGWRGRIRDELEAYGDTERTLYRFRWQRLENALDDLAFEADSARKILQHPKFMAHVDTLV